MEINLDGVIINYRLVRKKIKNLYMKFNENGTLEVKAPKSMSQSLIDRFLKEKIKWIIIQKNRYDLMLDEKETDIFKEGEFLYFLGKKYFIKIVEDKKNEVFIKEDANKEKNLLVIKIKSKYLNNIEYIKKIYEKWLKNECLKICIEYVNIYVKKMGEYNIPKPSVDIKKFKAKWGCCIPKKKMVEFSLNLVKTPIDCIEYVVVHELAHFKYINHNRDFYNFVSIFVPDWKNRRNLLNKKFAGIIS